MAKAKKRRNRKRQTVKREERCAATAETIAKLRPWPMQDLLRRGPHAGGLDSQQFESALLIVEAFDVITRGLGFKPIDLGAIGGGGSGEMGPRDERLWMIYIAWANEFQRRAKCRPHVVVGWVKDERPIDPGAAPLIAKAADMWDRAAGDYDRARRLLTTR